MSEKITIADYIAQAGSMHKTSDWVTVDQELINKFADATHDHQFIHVDEQKAKMTPFGGTIAHGFLSLSLLSHFAETTMPRIQGAVMAINYGFEKIRFLMPVPSGSRVRGHMKVAEVTEREPGQYLTRYEVSIEIEGNDKPALIAEWLGLTIVQG
ncbi:MAG: MaoC family dehydratase [Pseudomonadota bacterium]